MPTFANFILPLALILPQPSITDGAKDVPAANGEAKTAWLLPQSQQDKARPASEAWLSLEAVQTTPLQQQVRVQQRVIIRISPQRSPRTDLMATLPQRELPERMAERKIGKCLPLKSIAGVMPTRDNRLMLFLRDQRIIAANLEKACAARDFYSGFYVEPNDDGRICIDRDKLQSRTGAKCEMSRIRELIEVDT